MTVTASDGEQAALTADRILEAARVCFLRFGLHKTTMEDIARQTGVSRGSVYRHFPDKESLFRAVNERLAHEFTDEVVRRTEHLDGLGAKIEEGALMAMSFLSANPVTPGVGGIDSETIVTAVTTNGSELLRIAIDAIVPMVEEAVEAGEARADLEPRRAAEWIVLMVLSMISAPSVTFDRDDPEQVRAFIREFLMTGLN